MFPADGFDAGVKVLPWGTSLQDALAQLPTAIEMDFHSAKFQSARAFGLAGILSVTLRAPALDRPVMQVSCEMAAGRSSDNELLKEIVRVFGPPAQSAAHDPVLGVKFVARWDVPGFEVGLSIYAAPRETPEGLAAAVFYLHWDDLPAAAPYLESMIETENWLTARAHHAEIIWQDSLEADQHPYQPLATRSIAPHLLDVAQLRAARCLRRRLLIQTPAYLSESISARQVLIWKDVHEHLWCISTRYETVCFKWGWPVAATHINRLPAKGPGGASFSISDLDLFSSANSLALNRLAAFLQQNLPVQVSFVEDFDI